VPLDWTTRNYHRRIVEQETALMTRLCHQHFALYPQVVPRNFTSFRVVRFAVFAGHDDFCSGLDSRQVH